MDRNSVHEPYREDCLECHEDHFGEGRLILVEEGNDLCLNCHELEEEGLQASHRRLPVGNLECINCHDPHTSDKIKLLRENIHRPLAYGQCQDCHRSDGRLNIQRISLLCFRCHDTGLFRGASEHKPVVHDDCTICHDPHGSPYPALLTGPYSMERFTSFSEEKYGLCFECHDSDYFYQGDAGAETGFKDSRGNLHYLHTVKDRIMSTGNVVREGITCRNCHLPHASSRPRLIREALDCGGGVLCLRLEFYLKDSVGTCTAGCHKPSSYSAKGKEIEPERQAEIIGGERIEVATLAEGSPSRCLECHDRDWERYQKKFIHRPVEKKRCDECHIDHGSENRLILLAYEGRLCGRCHKSKRENFLSVHGGMEIGDSHCLSCHDPHASESEALLYPFLHEPYGEGSCDDCHDDEEGGWLIGRPVNEVCLDCHEDLLESTYLHGAIDEQSCLGCHNPHSSLYAGLLLGDNPALCYRCHDQRVFTRTFQHEPVADGNCRVCHDAHGSEMPGLLTGSYVMERYWKFDAGSYGVCFSCHDEGPFIIENFTGTGFRDGQRNLHYLHVNDREEETSMGNKTILGTTCRNCHEPHSTEDPSLIRRALDCGGVPCLNLEFKKIGDSGRCSRGCHTQKRYSP